MLESTNGKGGDEDKEGNTAGKGIMAEYSASSGAPIPLSCWYRSVVLVDEVVSFTSLARLVPLGPSEGAAGTQIAVDHIQRPTGVHKCTRLHGVNDSWVVASIRISADDVT
eukprot:360866-Chlamydomonas_euryale.AAC.3